MAGVSESVVSEIVFAGRVVRLARSEFAVVR
jgi:hypothetical protein